MVKILMVEDDRNMGFLLKENFKNKGYDIHISSDGEEGLKAFDENDFDLCILDVMMPKKDGFHVAQEIRKKNDQIPIIFLSAKSMEEDKCMGFAIGGDDYVTKPFSAQELLMRIQAVLKRSHFLNNPENPDKAGKTVFVVNKLTFDYLNRTLAIGETKEKLSTKEAELIKMFFDNKNTLIKRKDILLQVWGRDDYFSAKSMDVYLNRVRKKLKQEPCIEIQNMHGTGFKMIIHKTLINE